MQNQKLRTFFTLFFLSLFIFSFSQDKSKYNLLWRIEGNGLTQPSYLFGTMHVKDARAFDFSDSVMTAIEKTSIFALELHPDTMISSLLRETFNEDTTNRLKEILSEEEYAHLNKEFREKQGFDMEELNIKNPFAIRQFFKPKHKAVAEKQTFVDAYLYGIARMMGKRIEGLEEVEDQIEYLDGSTEEDQKEMIYDLIEMEEESYETYLNELIDVYNGGNLTELEIMVGNFGINDPIMTSRNKVMANRMIELMKEASIFTGVGAAHLPGDSGVIKLLQQQGYKVNPVKATFTGVADKYELDINQIEWTTFKDELKGFSVEMPGQPAPLKLIPHLDMKIYPDLLSESSFSFFTLDLRGAAEEPDEDKLIKEIIKNMKRRETAEILKKKKIVFNGLNRTELLLKTSESSRSRAQFIMKNNILYCLFGEWRTSASENKQVRRFFESFAAFTPAPTKSKDWVTFKNEKGAFSALMPSQPEEKIQESPNPIQEDGDPFISNLYMSINNNTQTVYLIAYNDFPKGLYMESKTKAFKGVKEELKGKASFLAEEDTIWLDGVEGREYEMMILDRYYAKMWVFIRGNRAYKILKQNGVSGQKSLVEDDFFESFSFEPYQKTAFTTYEPEGDYFSIAGIGEPYVHTDTTNDNESFLENFQNYFFTNPNSGGVYVLETSFLKEYFNVQAIDTFYQSYVDQLVEWSDTLLSKENVTIAGQPGIEVIIKNKYKKNKSRYRFWIDNDRLFILSGFLDNSEINNESTDEFFNSFQKTGEGNTFDIFAPKTDLILKGLASEDTSQQARAIGALDYHNFTKDDLPTLESAMFKSYSDDSVYMGRKGWLVINVAYLKEESSIPALKKLYQDESTSDPIKSRILHSLKDSGEPTYMTAFVDLFLVSPPQDPVQVYDIIEPFEDSLNLFTENQDFLIQLLENEAYRKNILSMFLSWANEDTIPNLLENSAEKLLVSAKDDLDAYLKKLADSDDEYIYQPEIWHYLRLLRIAKKQPIADEFTQQLILKEKNEYIQARAIAVRIINGLDVDKKMLKEFLTSLETRSIVLAGYEDAGELADAPKKYIKPAELAKMALYDYASDDGSPDGMTLLGEIAHPEGTVYAFKIMYEYEGNKSEYVGVSRPIKKGSKMTLENMSSYSSWDEMGPDWKSKAQEMIKEL